MNKLSMYTAAIIGISGYGEKHFADLKESYPKDTMKIIGATVINQNEEVEKCDYLSSHECEIFTDYKEMLAKLNGKIDLCCIPTGISSHKDMTIAALEAGANVFVEKPLCATIQDAMAIKNAEIKSGKFVIVGYQHIAQPSVMELKRILLSGQLGKVKSLKCIRFKPNRKSYYFRNNWAGKLRSANGGWVLDSPYNNNAAHNLNLLLFLAGNDFESTAELKNIRSELYKAKEYIESADTGFMRIETVDGKIIFFATSLSCDSSGTDMFIECENGSVSLKDGSYIVSYDNGEQENLPATLCRHPVTRTIYNKLQNPKSFACSIDIAAAQTLAMNGAHESSEIVKIPEEFTEIAKKGEDKEITVIKDLEKIINSCYKNFLLPSELANIEWAKPGKLFNLCDYHEFKGGRTGK